MNTETNSDRDLKQIEGEVARRLFHEKNGDSLMRDLRAIECSLLMHQQDLDRGMENEEPNKFRWRVNPTVAARLRKERVGVEAALQKLLDDCDEEAKKIVGEVYAAAPADTALEAVQPDETQPTLDVTSRPSAAEQEAAPKAPIPEAA